VSVAHSKCVPCGARVWRDGPESDHVGDLCPGCGGRLEAVADLSELVGLRALRARPRHAHRRPDLSARISQQIRETIARNDAERRRIDGERA
jgi:predicted  nucleic acid-binding Zn-ribbon protein